MKRRLLAALMCVCMLIGLIPATAMAEGHGNGGGGTTTAGSIEVAFYYIYSNEVPSPAHEGSGEAVDYGPSANDTPFVTATINLDALFDKLKENEDQARRAWNKEEGYITAATCGYSDNSAWWSAVVACMDSAGQKYFQENALGQMFQGYVIKHLKDGASKYQNHCDGILTKEPPLYLVELYDGDEYIQTLYSSTNLTSATAVRDPFKAYLEEKYGEGTMTWDSFYAGTYIGADDSYRISLAYTPELNQQGTLVYNPLTNNPNNKNYYLAKVTLTATECYTVTYDANGGKGDVPTDDNLYEAMGIAYIQYSPTPTRDGYTFLGWDRGRNETDPEFKQDGDTQAFNINGNTTLYAIWQANAPGLSVDKNAQQLDDEGHAETIGESVTVGDTIHYTVTVSNSGGPAENVQVSDTMFPSGGSDVTVSGTGAGGTWSGTTYTISKLDTNESVTFTYDYDVTSSNATAGSIENTATVQYGSEAPIYKSVTVTVKNPQTTVRKTAVSLTQENLPSSITWTSGSAPEYTPVTVDGSSRTLTIGNVNNVTLLYVVSLTAVDTDTVTVTDEGANYVGYQSVGSNGIQVSNSDGTYTVKWTDPGTKESPASAYLYFTKTVEVNESLKEIGNTVTVDGDKTATSKVPVYQVKSVDKEVLTSVPQSITAPDNLANFIQVDGKPTVLIPANADKIALLYRITVTGTAGATFTVEDDGAKFWGGSAWNGTGTGTIGSDGTCTLYCYKTFEKGSGWGESLSNTAAVLGYKDTAETPVKVAQGVITVTPVDMTAYMGGTSSYWEDMNGTYVPGEESGIPAPRFYVELNGVNASADVVFHGTDSTGETAKKWSLELYSDAADKYVWHIRGVDNASDASCLYFADAGLTEHVTQDNFTTGEFAHLYATISTSDSTGAGNTNLYATDAAGNYYTLDMGVGNLYIREVTTDGETYAAAAQAEEATENGTQAGVVIPEGTTFTVNGKEGWTLGGENENVSLLFDELLSDLVTDHGVNLLEEAIANNAEKLGLTISDTTQYQSKYLDLVDNDDGNVWVKASSVLTVYWPYPDDITYENAQDYDFSLFHFTGMHREDRVYTDTSSMIDLAVQNINGEKTPVTDNSVLSLTEEDITLTENGIQFTVDQSKAGFSPFVLVYDTKAEEPVPETVTVTFKSGEHGHFAYGHTQRQVELDKGDSLTDSQIPYVFVDEGYEFIGWYENGSGSWHLYSDEDLLEMTFNSDATFIAQYKYVGGPSVDDEYDVVYNANFTDGGVPRRQGYDKGETVTVSENKWFERDGYIFVGWNTEADGTGDSYDPDDTFKMPGRDVYLYAQWQKEKPGPDDTGVSRWLETEDHNAYLTGYPDSTFGADRNMTRAEVAQMFYSLLKNKNVMITTSFSDVSNDAWYATAVKTMASLGMMSGYPDGTFRPDEPITRAEFATVALAFAYEPDNARCSYLDVSTSAWYYTYVAQATTYGWIGGYPDGTFRPNNSITRVEVCVIVNNMLGRTPDEDYIDRNEDELVNFVDLSDRYWGYYTIMEATNGHEYTGNYSNETWESVK